MPHNTSNPLLLSVRDTATLLGITPWSVYRLCDSGELASRYQGRRRYVTREGIDRYIARLPTAPPAESA